MALSDFLDGHTARIRKVDVALEGRRLTLREPTGRMLDHWPLEALRRVPGTPKSASELRLKPSDLALSLIHI